MSQNDSELSALDNEEDSMLDAIDSITSENEFNYLRIQKMNLSPDSESDFSGNSHLESPDNQYKSTSDDLHNVNIRFVKGKNVFLDSKINERNSPKSKEIVFDSESDSEASNQLDSSPMVQSFENFDGSKFLDPIDESIDKDTSLEDFNIIDSLSKSYFMNKESLNTESNPEDEEEAENQTESQEGVTVEVSNKDDESGVKLKVCSQCPMTFKYKRHFDRHMEGHEKNNCSHCHAKFARRKHLDVHLFRIHGQRTNNRYPHSCDICFHNFPKKILLNRHRAKHFENDKVCPECGVIMESDVEIQKHKLKHEKEKQFQCTRCPQKFSTEQTYQNHIQNHDNYKCPNCDASFASKKTASKHFRLNHSSKSQSIKPMKDGLYFCSDCHQGFVKKSGYCRHLETAMHLNKINQEGAPKASFACPICKKNLSTRPACVQHIRRVHRGEKKLTCNTEGCSFQCAYKNDLDRHEQLHVEERNVVCEYCGKAFTSISILKDHILYIHNMERQFVCEECGKAFKRNSLLNRHKLSHQQLRPYACKECVAAFKRSHHLTRHMESCHKLTLEKKKKVVKLMKTDNGDLIPVPDQVEKSKCKEKETQLTTENESEDNSSLNQQPVSTETENSYNSLSNTENLNFSIEIPNNFLQADASSIVSLVDVHSGQVVTVVSNQESLPIDDIVNQFEESCNEMLDLGFQSEILNKDQNYYNHGNYSELQMEDVQESLLNSSNVKDSVIDNYLTQTFPTFLNL